MRLQFDWNLDWLSGKRTYIMIAVDAIDQLGIAQGWWEEARLRYIVEFVLTGVALRAGLPVAPVAPVAPKV